MVSKLSLSNATVAEMMVQAGALERAGRFIEAQRIYQSLLGLERSNLGAFVGLGRTALQCGNPHVAVRYYEKAVKINPKAAELRNQLAIAFLRIGRPDKAETQALISYKLDQNSLATLKILNEIYYLLGRPAKSQLYLERAVTLQPGDLSLKLALAQNADVSGDLKKAQTLFREVIASDPGNAIAYRGLAFSQKFTEEPAELAAIEAFLAEAEIPPGDREKLHRAAGKILEDLGRHDRAFAHFMAAGRFGAASETEAEIAEKIRRIKATFTPQFYLDRADFGSKSQRPVFVFGMPRSGTTLIEQILASHPNVHGAGELNFFAINSKRLMPDRLVRDDARKIAKDYLHLLQAYSSRAARVVDKMPYNFERLWLLALLFPKASFIHCRRDPLATCVSCFVQFYAGDLELLGRSYCQYHDLMDFWRRTLPVTFLDVDYEVLIQDQEGQSRNLIAHIGLDWNDSCLNFHVTKRSVRTPSRRQVEQPIYKSSLEGWRRYEKHLEPLIKILGDLGRSTGQFSRSPGRAADDQ
jgi:tetratricopeptide (TPR) repeat protein